jgi:hypothetical protein
MKKEEVFEVVVKLHLMFKSLMKDWHEYKLQQIRLETARNRLIEKDNKWRN